MSRIKISFPGRASRIFLAFSARVDDDDDYSNNDHPV